MMRSALAFALLLEASALMSVHRKPELQFGIIKPRADTRNYSHATLSNGLKVMMVQDENAVTDSFAVAVDAGTWDDPEGFLGLAHFCEHMLFLGTEKYPDPVGKDSYDSFVNENGGYLNAYTADEKTVYFSSINAPAMPEALDRFSDFFWRPRFNETFVDKEVKAIDSEHKKNMENPGRQVFEVMNSLSNPECPRAQFHTGNFETLGDPSKHSVPPVKALRSWFADHYCPSRMRVAVFGNEDMHVQLDRLESTFGRIPAGSSTCQEERRSWSTPVAWGEQQLGKLVYVEGTTPTTSFYAVFPFGRDISKEWSSNPMRYISHALNYAGEDSLKRVLQDTLGLVTGVSIGVETSSQGTQFMLNGELTELGKKDIGLVLDVFFQYLAGVKRKGVNKAMLESLKNVDQLHFDWASQSDGSSLTQSLAPAMFDYPIEKILPAGAIMEEMNVSLIEELLNVVRPYNMNVIIIDPAAKEHYFKTDEQNMTVKSLPYYGVKHLVTELNLNMEWSHRLDKWASWLGDPAKARTELSARLQDADIKVRRGKTPFGVEPSPLEHVPARLSEEHMKAVEFTKEQHPTKSEELFGHRPEELGSGGAKLVKQGVSRPETWYRQGWLSISPRVHFRVNLKRLRSKAWLSDPMRDHTLQDHCRSVFFNQLLQMEMAPKMVDWQEVGAGYTAAVGSNSLSFSFEGYEPLMVPLMEKVMLEFSKGIDVNDTARFDRLRKQFEDNLKDDSEMPSSTAMSDRNILLSMGQYSKQEKLAMLPSFTPQWVKGAPEDWVTKQSFKLTTLAMGNLPSKSALNFVNRVYDSLPTMGVGASDDGEIEEMLPIVRINEPIEVRKKNPRDGDHNFVTATTILLGVGDIPSRVLSGILSQIVHQVAFDELRTKQQLGYVVSAGMSRIENIDSIVALVQGDVLEPDATEGAIERVLTTVMPEHLRGMSDEDFERQKHAFEQALVEPPLKDSDEFEHFWGPLSLGGKCWNLRESMIAYVKSEVKSKQVLLDFWQRSVTPPNGEARKKVTVKYFPGEAVPPRPSLEEATALWRKHGVSDASIALLTKEYGATEVLDKVDSEARHRLQRKNGLMPEDRNCEWAPPAAGAK